MGGGSPVALGGSGRVPTLYPSFLARPSPAGLRPLPGAVRSRLEQPPPETRDLVDAALVLRISCKAGVFAGFSHAGFSQSQRKLRGLGSPPSRSGESHPLSRIPAMLFVQACMSCRPALGLNAMNNNNDFFFLAFYVAVPSNQVCFI